MPYLYLIGAMCSSCALSVCGSLYNRKNAARHHVSNLYNLLIACSMFVCWCVMYIADFSFDLGVLPYSLGFAACYTLAMIGHIKALGSGSVALTAFVKQLSLVAVSFWGFVFWDTPLSLNVAIGIVLITVALALCFLKRKAAGEKAATVTARWFAYAAVLLIGNAGCSIIQKYQQFAFDGQHGAMLMVFAALFSAVICVLLSLREKKDDWSTAAKTTWFFPVGAGFASAMLNLFVLLMASTALSPSVIYPGIAVGGVTLTTLVSVFIFREKLSQRQWLGLGVGVVALVFLNLS